MLGINLKDVILTGQTNVGFFQGGDGTVMHSVVNHQDSMISASLNK